MSGLPMLGFPSKSIANVKNMQKIIGPKSCHALVLSSLDSCTNKLHWAVNSYYRSIFINGVHCDTMKSSVSRSSQLLSSSESDESSPAQSIPLEIMVMIVKYLDFISVTNWYSTNKKFRSHCSKVDSVSAGIQPFQKSILREAEYDAYLNVWSQQLLYRSYVISKCYSFCKGIMVGGRRPERTPTNENSKINVGSSTFMNGEENLTGSGMTAFTSDKWYSILKQPADSFDPFQQFKLCYIAEKTKSCLHCRAVSSIVPVVYGFPSASLIGHHRERRLQMGGDYLIEGAAAYTCLKCNCQFFCYPYSCCVIDALDS